MAAKSRGKRSGYRAVYYLLEGETVWLITVYDKVEKEDLSTEEEHIIGQLVQRIKLGRA